MLVYKTENHCRCTTVFLCRSGQVLTVLYVHTQYRSTHTSISCPELLKTDGLYPFQRRLFTLMVQDLTFALCECESSWLCPVWYLQAGQLTVYLGSYCMSCVRKTSIEKLCMCRGQTDENSPVISNTGIVSEVLEYSNSTVIVPILWLMFSNYYSVLYSWWKDLYNIFCGSGWALSRLKKILISAWLLFYK